MSEARQWEYIRDKVKGRVLMERITEKLNPGVPDVVYTFEDAVGGWLELKYLANAPRDPAAVRIPWKSTDQPFWLNKWARAGGRAGVLLYIRQSGWHYWRARKDIDWIRWVQVPVPLDSSTWSCGPHLDVEGLLAALR